MKPKITPYYETSDGRAVKTLDEWKRAEINFCLKNQIGDVPSTIVDAILTQAGALVDILSQVERGRPKGSKTRNKTKLAVVPPTAA